MYVCKCVSMYTRLCMYKCMYACKCLFIYICVLYASRQTKVTPQIFVCVCKAYNIICIYIIF